VKNDHTGYEKNFASQTGDKMSKDSFPRESPGVNATKATKELRIEGTKFFVLKSTHKFLLFSYVGKEKKRSSRN
jgi:hypothetical protein